MSNIRSRLYDTYRFICVLSIYKVYNLLGVWVSFYLSRYLRRPIGQFLPFTLTFEPNTSCNLMCPECPSGLRSFTRPTGHSDIDLYKRFVDSISSHCIYLYLYFQGEPFLHRSFLDMVTYAKSKRLYTVTSTNGHFITPRKAEEIVKSGLDRIIISIDGYTQEVYEQYRVGGTLTKVISGAQHLVSAKRRLGSQSPFIIFQTLVLSTNEHQILDIKRLADQIGVDHFTLKTAQIYDYRGGNDLIPSIDDYSRYAKLSDGSYVLKNSLENQCWKLWHAAVCTFDGMILPCCFDKDAEYSMGSIVDSDLSTIWVSEPYRAFRQKLLMSRKEISICQNCSEGTKVWESIG